MPVKRRNPKRKLNAAAELEAWSGLFDCGYDFFDDLDVLGLTEQEALQGPAAEAWSRLGAAFLADWKGRRRHPEERQVPWALEQFGEPNNAR